LELGDFELNHPPEDPLFDDDPRDPPLDENPPRPPFASLLKNSKQNTKQNKSLILEDL
jgi:hypothetical protein